MASIYSTMLEQLFSKSSLTKEALLSVSNSSMAYSRNAEKALKKAFENGHVKETKTLKYDEKLTRTEVTYRITSEGIRYLIDKAKDADNKKDKTDTEWIKYIEWPEGRRLNSFAELPDERERVNLISEAALMAELAGANVPLILYDEYDRCEGITKEDLSPENIAEASSILNSTLYSTEAIAQREKDRQDLYYAISMGDIVTPQSLIRSAAKLSAEELCREAEKKSGIPHDVDEFMPGRDDISDDEFIRFVTPTTVKYVSIINSMDSDTSKHDTDRGKFVGLLQSKKRSMLLYDTHYPVFKWYSFKSEREINALARWNNRLADLFNIDREKTKDAALLVPNLKAFRQMLDCQDNFEKKTGECRIASDFDHFYIFPVHTLGAKAIRETMLSTTNEYESKWIEKLLDLGYERNDGFYHDLLPIRYKSTYVAIGMRMELHQMMLLRKITEMDKDLTVLILCQPWQEEYYKYAVPNGRAYFLEG